MSDRQRDIRGEKALGLFLDEFFYPEFRKTEGFDRSERIYDIKTQKSGGDLLLFNKKGNSFIVDEKAQLHFINSPKPTFAFEISFIQEESGDVLDGWFVSKNNKTDYYLLAWINDAKTDKYYRLVAEDFLDVTVCCIAKQHIISYLSQHGLSIEKIRSLALELRKSESNASMKLANDVILYFSKEKYVEEPINIVISHATLSKLALGEYNVTRDNVTKILR